MADEIDDDAMAQWAADNATGELPGGDDGWTGLDDLGGGGGDGMMGAERILNQDEIDSLLGFDFSTDNDDDRTGIRAIINSALVSYERLPMLEIVFDRRCG